MVHLLGSQVRAYHLSSIGDTEKKIGFKNYSPQNCDFDDVVTYYWNEHEFKLGHISKLNIII